MLCFSLPPLPIRQPGVWDPNRAHDLDRRDCSQSGGSQRSASGGEQRSTVFSHRLGEGETIPFCFGEAAFLHAMTVAFDPAGLTVAEKPIGCHNRQTRACNAHRCSYVQQTVARWDLGQHLRGSGALALSRFHPSSVLAPLEQRVSEPLLGASFNQPLTTCTPHAGITDRIRPIQSQQRCPIDPTTNRIGCLPVGEFFQKLEDRHQGETPRSLDGATVVWKERGKRLLLGDGSSLIPELPERLAPWRGRVGHTDGLWRKSPRC